MDVHANDAPEGRAVDEQIDSERCLPGETGLIDIVTFLTCLKRIGYDSSANAAELVSLGYEPDAVANLAKSLPEATVLNATSAIDDSNIAQKVAQLCDLDLPGPPISSYTYAKTRK